MGELYTGYHGTTISRGESILKNKYYFVSYKEDEWLGNGVYFFEKDINQAVDFCTKARRYDDYIILKSKIEAETVSTEETVIRCGYRASASDTESRERIESE